MNKRNHPDRLTARRELVAEGFVSAHNSPGRPELWAKSKDKRHFAIQRERRPRSEVWHIVPYPEPAVCSPDEARTLAERDGIVLNGGQMPVSANMEVEDETDWLDEPTEDWLA